MHCICARTAVLSSPALSLEASLCRSFCHSLSQSQQSVPGAAEAVFSSGSSTSKSARIAGLRAGRTRKPMRVSSHAERQRETERDTESEEHRTELPKLTRQLLEVCEIHRHEIKRNTSLQIVVVLQSPLLCAAEQPRQLVATRHTGRVREYAGRRR